MSVRSLAAIVACAVVGGGILASVPWPGQIQPAWSTPEMRQAESVRVHGIPGTLVACDIGPPRLDVHWSVNAHMVGTIPVEPGEATPAEALAAYVHADPRVPRLEYKQQRLPDDRILFTYAAGDKIKIAVGVGRDPRGPGYLALQSAMCGPAELLPSAGNGFRIHKWRNLTGTHLVPVNRVYGQPPFPGPAGCDGAGVSLLWLRGTPYVRDPNGTFPGTTNGPYQARAVLPADAVDTRYRRNEVALWRAADSSAVYVVRPGGVERLPREQSQHGNCV